jgi:8-oxo-dGTP diphosphatase
MIKEIDADKEMIFGDKIQGIDYIVRVGAYGVMLNEAGHVAVMKTPYGHFLPGGGLEHGESPQECIIREFEEEIGCGIQIKKFIGKASKYYFSDVFNQYRHPIGFFYIVSLDKQVTIALEKDLELLWMKPLECINCLHEHQAWAVKEALTI